MPALTSLASAVEPKPASSRAVPLPLVLGGLFLGALWFILCRHLSSEWAVNQQYNYGWFVPFFAIYLFWLRWEERPGAEDANAQRQTPNAQRPIFFAIASILLGLLLLLPIRLFELGNPDWRPISWLHANVVVAVTLLAIWSIGGTRWLKHFAFPVVFFLVAVPWITPVEEPIIQGLMRIVAAIATEAVALLGIPAQLEGNLIRINNGLVGVNEACSGVRSLQTSLMIGLLFGEIKRLPISRRITLVALAIAIALVANLGRAIFLVWIAAAKGIAEVDHWHDVAGYVIVGIVFFGTLLLATWLAKSSYQLSVSGSQGTDTGELGSDNPTGTHGVFRVHWGYATAGLAWLLAVEISAAAWYRSHENEMTLTARWNVRWPESAPGFRELKIQEGIRSTLRFDEGREVAWRENVEKPDAGVYLLYFFRWEPGTSTILRARAHRPDICLPSAGWRQIADNGIRDYQVAPQFAVPFRHFAFARENAAHSPPIYAHAFFCLREDTVRPGQESPLSDTRPDKWSRSDRWRVVRDGIRNPGQQVMEFLMVSPHQRSSEEAAAEFGRLVPSLIQIQDHKTAGDTPASTPITDNK